MRWRKLRIGEQFLVVQVCYEYCTNEHHWCQILGAVRFIEEEYYSSDKV